MKKRWSAIEDDIVRRLYPTAERQDILDALPGRTWQQIIQRAKHLHVRRKRNQHAWEPEEESILMDLFSTTQQQELTRVLPRHSFHSIQKRAEQIGLRRNGGYSEKTAGVSPKAHHQDMSKTYFPASRPLQLRPGLDAPSLLRDLQEGVIALVRRINAGRMDASE